MTLSKDLKQDHECGDYGLGLEGYHERAKALEDELTQLKKDAYFMRVIIHEQGLHDWQPEPKARIEKILYGDGDKLIGAD